MQVLEQQGALAGRIAEQGAHGVELGLLEHPALGKGRALAPAGSGMDRPAHGLPAAARDLRYVVHAHQFAARLALAYHIPAFRTVSRGGGCGRRRQGVRRQGAICQTSEDPPWPQANKLAQQTGAANWPAARPERVPRQACDGLARVADVALSLTGDLQVWP